MSEREDVLVSEPELVELFRRRRPDPVSFRAGIAERIAAAERAAAATRTADDHGDAVGGGEVPRDRASVRGEFLRRAAAFLPLDPTGGSAFGKLLVTSLALPFLTLAATIGAFAAAGRSVRRSAGSAVAPTAEPRAVLDIQRSKNKKLRFGARFGGILQTLGMVLFLLPVVTGAKWAVDVVVALVLLATASLVLIVRGLAESSLLTKRMVAAQASVILVGLFAGVFLWPMSWRAVEAGTELGAGWSAGVVLVGVTVCALKSRMRTGWLGRSVLLLVPLVLFLNPLGLTLSSASSLRGYLASTRLDARDLAGWEAFGLTAEALVAIGETVPPVPAIERELDRALAIRIDDPAHGWTVGVDEHARVWTAASQAGLMTHERWCALAERATEKHKLDALLALSSPLQGPDYAEYEIAMLVATRTLTREQREALAARIEAAWPATGSHDPLANALVRVRMLDHLGFGDRVEARRADIHALLRDHWFPNRTETIHGSVGGFTPNPEQFATSMSGSTHAAVVLMARVGVPDGVDLRRVRDFLRAESAELLFLLPSARRIDRAALLRLEREIGVPSVPWLELLLGERMLIACLMLVVLCLIAIRAAPGVDTAVRRGAMP